MEDNEEIQSPALPRSDGRITVTVAVSAPQQSTKALAVALPVQKAAPGGGREDCWSEGATEVLIDAWGERYLELSRGNLKQKHWSDVADIVNGREDYTKIPKSDIQCKNRIDTVKKKYKLEKAKIAAGRGASKWPLFHKLDRLIGPSAKTNSTAAAPPANTGNQKLLPMGVRSGPLLRQHQPPPPPPQPPKQTHSFFRNPPVDSGSSESEPENSADYLPAAAKKRRIDQREFTNSNTLKPIGNEKNENWGKSVRELSEAIAKFGEAYERTESARVDQMVEMEKQRMKFAKEMELQRMQFFMKTQMDLSQLYNRSRSSIGKTNHHIRNINTAAASAIIKNSNITTGN